VTAPGLIEQAHASVLKTPRQVEFFVVDQEVGVEVSSSVEEVA